MKFMAVTITWWHPVEVLCVGTSAEICDREGTKRGPDNESRFCQRHYRQWKAGKLDIPFTPAHKPSEPRQSWGRSRGEAHRSAKLTESAVRELRRLRDEEGYSYPELSRRFHIHEQTARKAYQGKTWGHV